MKNIFPNKIINGRYLKKLDNTKSCLAKKIINLNYSLLFSMRADDHEQYLN